MVLSCASSRGEGGAKSVRGRRRLSSLAVSQSVCVFGSAHPNQIRTRTRYLVALYPFSTSTAVQSHWLWCVSVGFRFC